MQVVLRPYCPDTDDPFIYSSWKISLFVALKKEILQPRKWFQKTDKEISALLKSKPVRVACIKGMPDHIVGYAIMDEKEPLFVYIKKDYRDQGIEKLLTPGDENGNQYRA